MWGAPSSAGWRHSATTWSQWDVQAARRRLPSGIALRVADYEDASALKLVMHHALSLSIIRGRGDVVTRLILPLSPGAYAMQLCKQGLVIFANSIGGVWTLTCWTTQHVR